MLNPDHPIVVQLQSKGYRLSLHQNLKGGRSMVTVGAKPADGTWVQGFSKSGDVVEALQKCVDAVIEREARK